MQVVQVNQVGQEDQGVLEVPCILVIPVALVVPLSQENLVHLVDPLVRDNQGVQVMELEVAFHIHMVRVGEHRNMEVEVGAGVVEA